MKTARILMAIAVCAALIGAMLTGCGSAANREAETSASATQTAARQQEQTTVKNEEPAVLKLLGITWGDYLADSPGNQRIHDALLKKLNIDIQATIIQKPDDWPSKVNLAIASGEQYDMMVISSEANLKLYRQLIDQQYIIPLDDLLNNYGKDILGNADPDIWSYLRVNGKIYAINYETEKCTNCVEIRKDLLDKYGLAMPTTIDEFEKAVLLIKQKENMGRVCNVLEQPG